MANTTGRKVQSPMFSGSFLIFVVLLVGFLPLLALLSSQVAYASPQTTQHTKLQFPGLRHTINAATAPSPTISRYISPLDKDKPSRLYTDGCKQASAGVGGSSNVGGTVILDFGATVLKSGSGYGTYLPGSNPNNPAYISNSQINTLVEQYINGFIHCNSINAFLHLGIGTNNQRFTTGAVATADGQEWGTLVSNVNSWINSQFFSSWVEVYGASDIELDWSNAASARAWTNGFLKTFSFYFDYGDAAGCPTKDSTSDGTCTTPHFVWHQSDVAYVSWNATGALPLPEIYTTSGSQAAQWQSIVYYQRNNRGASSGMVIWGTLTQSKACQQNPKKCPSGTDNKPAAGWTQLYNDLNAPNAGTGQDLNYSSDIQWD